MKPRRQMTTALHSTSSIRSTISFRSACAARSGATRMDSTLPHSPKMTMCSTDCAAARSLLILARSVVAFATHVICETDSIEPSSTSAKNVIAIRLWKCRDRDKLFHSFSPSWLVAFDFDLRSQDSNGGNMFHLIWYILVGLIAGVIAKSIMHVHLTLMWTIILGIVGSILGGSVTHMFSRPREGAQFHPAGLIFSTLGALLVLFVCYKLKIRLPHG